MSTAVAFPLTDSTLALPISRSSGIPSTTRNISIRANNSRSGMRMIRTLAMAAIDSGEVTLTDMEDIANIAELIGRELHELCLEAAEAAESRD